MAAVTGILCQIITSDVDNAGTDGRVYLGIGGREFLLDSAEDDYERGSWREYILGRGPVEPVLPPRQIRVTNPDENDPRTGFPLDTSRLFTSPVYIRFEPVGDSPNWSVTDVFTLVYREAGTFVGYFTLPETFDRIWLGDPYGKTLYLTETYFPTRPGRLHDAIKDLVTIDADRDS